MPLFWPGKRQKLFLIFNIFQVSRPFQLNVTRQELILYTLCFPPLPLLKILINMFVPLKLIWWIHNINCRSIKSISRLFRYFSSSLFSQYIVLLTSTFNWRSNNRKMSTEFNILTYMNQELEGYNESRQYKKVRIELLIIESFVL